MVLNDNTTTTECIKKQNMVVSYQDMVASQFLGPMNLRSLRIQWEPSMSMKTII